MLLKSLEGNLIHLSYKLEFNAMNNIDRYEALVLGLQVSRDLKIECLMVFGYFDLIVKKIKN